MFTHARCHTSYGPRFTASTACSRATSTSVHVRQSLSLSLSLCFGHANLVVLSTGPGSQPAPRVAKRHPHQSRRVKLSLSPSLFWPRTPRRSLDNFIRTRRLSLRSKVWPRISGINSFRFFSCTTAMAVVPNSSSCFFSPIRSQVNASLTIQLPKTSLSIPSSERQQISETFSNLKKRGKVAFIPYITAGDPDLSTTAKALRLLDHWGADVIELGLPFSDPFLDGPVIQASSKRALEKRTDPRAVFSMLKEVVPQLSCPIAIFSYYNLILRHKMDWFMSALNDCGVQGLIVPDLPFEESASLRKEATRKEVDLVQLASPTTQKHRMKNIADATEGFLYLVSSVGVTGARPSVNPQVQFLLQEIKEVTTKPVAVGFGISKPEHVRQLSLWGADGVIVGSAIVKLLGEANSAEQGLRHVESFMASLKEALP